jgi:hypothetical protein
MRVLTRDWFAVLPGKIYPQVIAAGAFCPEGMEAEAKAAGMLDEPEAAVAQTPVRGKGKGKAAAE